MYECVCALYFSSSHKDGASYSLCDLKLSHSTLQETYLLYPTNPEKGKLFWSAQQLSFAFHLRSSNTYVITFYFLDFHLGGFEVQLNLVKFKSLKYQPQILLLKLPPYYLIYFKYFVISCMRSLCFIMNKILSLKFHTSVFDESYKNFVRGSKFIFLYVISSSFM